MYKRSLILALGIASISLHTQAVTLQSVDRSVENAIMSVADFLDSIGAYFNLCRPPLAQAVSDTASAVVKHVQHLDGESAFKAVSRTTQQMTDAELAYAPVTKFFTDYMQGTKAILGACALVLTVWGVKKLFFSKKRKKKIIH